MGRAFAVAAAVLALAAPALASAATPHHKLPSPLAPEPRLPKAEATRIFLSNDKVADWLSRYPRKDRTIKANYKRGAWTIKIWWGAAGLRGQGRRARRTRARGRCC